MVELFAHWTGSVHAHDVESSPALWGWLVSLVVFGTSVVALRAWFKRE